MDLCYRYDAVSFIYYIQMVSHEGSNNNLLCCIMNGEYLCEIGSFQGKSGVVNYSNLTGWRECSSFFLQGVRWYVVAFFGVPKKIPEKEHYGTFLKLRLFPEK